MTIKFSDITGGGIPFGNNAGRPADPGIGKLYSNGEAARLELYTATGWQNIVQEVPGVAAATGNYSEQTNSGTIIITGTNFVSGAIASAIGTNGVEVIASSTTYNSLVQLTATFTGLSNANEPYDIKVTNPSNLFGLIPDALYINASPVWQTASGSLGTFSELLSISVSATATDSDSSITYSLASGSSLPSGVSLNSSSGLISGVLPDVNSETIYSFTINASDGVNTIPRSFSFVSGPLTIPIEYLVVAGGGAGGDFLTGGGFNAAGGGGGAGGLIYSSSTNVSGFSLSYNISVGSAGVSTASSNSSGGFSTNGANSVLSGTGILTQTAVGGGRGGAGNSSIAGAYVAGSGGSGGGGVRPDGGSSFANGGGGTINQGNAGGSFVQNDGDGGGGGGSTAAGQGGGQGSRGGAGFSSNITGSTIIYAAGGGGGKGASGDWVSNNGGSGVGGSGGAKANNAVGGNASSPGSGGGGAGSSLGDNGIFAKGGNGSSGTVIIAYPNTFPPITTIPGTLTYDQPSRSGFRVYRFTAGSGTITF